MKEETILNLCSIIVSGVIAMTFLLSVVLPNILEAIAEYKAAIRRWGNESGKIEKNIKRA